MPYQSHIQWTDATHNFWTGCQKVSAGCKNCYMYRILDGKKVDASIVTRTKSPLFHLPIYWKTGKQIFTNSMSDFFIEEADPWRAEAWDVIRKTPQHRWLILTKRPERIAETLPKDWGQGYRNVALGVTIEDQKSIHRMHTLADVPAYIRFISAEPLLENVDLTAKNAKGEISLSQFGWIIIGGESGYQNSKHGFRITEISWIQRLIKDVRQNSTAGIFVKQLGTYQALTWGLKHSHGGDINEFPKGLQIREWAKHVEPNTAA